MKKKSIQIRIPEPCSEDWALMTPNEKGRHCAQCDKCVVDLSGSTDREVYQYVSEHAGEKMCGRLRFSQLGRDIKPDFDKSAPWTWLRMAASMLLGGMSVSAQAQEPQRIQIQEDFNQPGMRQVLISGLLTDANGAPLPDKLILCDGAKPVFTDSTGHYKLDLLTSGLSATLMVESVGNDYLETVIALDKMDGHSLILEQDIIVMAEDSVALQMLETDTSDIVFDFGDDKFWTCDMAVYGNFVLGGFVSTYPVDIVDDSKPCPGRGKWTTEYQAMEKKRRSGTQLRPAEPGQPVEHEPIKDQEPGPPPVKPPLKAAFLNSNDPSKTAENSDS